MANQLRSRYDIVINGGGIVGFTLLNLLSKSPQLSRAKVLLIEQTNKPAQFVQAPRKNAVNKEEKGRQRVFSNRVSSITYASKQAFKKLGVWDMLKPYVADVRKIKVWNYDYSHKIVFSQNLSPCNQDQEERDIMFSTVENNRLSSALLENLHRNSDAEKIIWNTSLEDMSESSDGGLVDVRVKNDQSEFSISAPLVIGCDGFQSKVRQITQIGYRECNLNKAAVVGTVRIAEKFGSDLNDIAYQRFCPNQDTVAALLPLDNEYSSFVISAPTNYAKQLVDLDDEAFVLEFNRLLSTKEQSNNILLKAVHGLVNGAYENLNNLRGLLDAGFLNDELPTIDRVVSNSRASFPLIFGTTSPRMVTSLPNLRRVQVALLGDASHRIHPLAGQGLNLGIQDAVELVNQLEAISRLGERVFDDYSLMKKALKRFEAKRQAYVIPMSAGILAMQDLFKYAPSSAMTSTNKCEPMKKLTVRVANGA